jgi:hypothetical protein
MGSPRTYRIGVSIGVILGSVNGNIVLTRFYQVVRESRMARKLRVEYPGVIYQVMNSESLRKRAGGNSCSGTCSAVATRR